MVIFKVDVEIEAVVLLTRVVLLTAALLIREESFAFLMTTPFAIAAEAVPLGIREEEWGIGSGSMARENFQITSNLGEN
ncbi:hypothetical protein P8452_52513 [Trifolium repens]|nr:hypothetical protein P8452_52513 [Trifolium repens]